MIVVTSYYYKFAESIKIVGIGKYILHIIAHKCRNIQNILETIFIRECSQFIILFSKNTLIQMTSGLQLKISLKASSFVICISNWFVCFTIPLNKCSHRRIRQLNGIKFIQKNQIKSLNYLRHDKCSAIKIFKSKFSPFHPKNCKPKFNQTTV